MNNTKMKKKRRGIREQPQLKERKRDQAKLSTTKINVNTSCGLNPGTEQEKDRSLQGFL